MIITLLSSSDPSGNNPNKVRNRVASSVFRQNLHKAQHVCLRSIIFKGEKPDGYFYVSCNLSDDQYIGSKSAPVIRLCNPENCQELSGYVHSTRIARPLQYIEVELLDQDLKLLELPASTEVIVILELLF